MEGYDNTKYLVDLNFKIAFPFIVIIMVVIGMALSFKTERGGIPFAVLLGICVCFLYTVTLLYSRFLGFSGLLPPMLAAWIGNMFFLLFGVYLMLGVER
jgi:lipopolysaccharide export system permease protein